MATKKPAPAQAALFDFDFDASPNNKKPVLPKFDAPDEFDSTAYNAMSPRSAEAPQSKKLKKNSSAKKEEPVVLSPKLAGKARKVSAADLAENESRMKQQSTEDLDEDDFDKVVLASPVAAAATAKPKPKKMKKAASAAVTTTLKSVSPDSEASDDDDDDDAAPPLAKTAAPKKAAAPISEEDSGMDDSKDDTTDDDDAKRKPKKVTRKSSASPNARSSRAARSVSTADTTAAPRISAFTAPPAIDEEDAGAEEKAVAAAANAESGPVDAWEKMHDGACLLKFGKSGDPHFRIVGLTEDRKAIVFFSKGKSRSKTRIEIAQITRVTEGLKGRSFASAIALAGEFRDLAFSIWYNNEKDSLDLLARNRNDFVIWTKGLQALIDEAKSPAGVEACMVNLRPIGEKKKLIVEAKRVCKERRALQEEITKINRRVNDISAVLEDMRNLHAFTRTETWTFASHVIEGLKKVKELRVDTANVYDLDYDVWWLHQQLDALMNLAEVVDCSL